MQRALLLDDEELERTIPEQFGPQADFVVCAASISRRLLLDGESRDIFYFFRSRSSFCSVLFPVSFPHSSNGTRTSTFSWYRYLSSPRYR